MCPAKHSRTAPYSNILCRVLAQAREGVEDPAAAARNCTFDAPPPGVVLIAKDPKNLHSRWEYLLDPLGTQR